MYGLYLSSRLRPRGRRRIPALARHYLKVKDSRLQRLKSITIRLDRVRGAYADVLRGIWATVSRQAHSGDKVRCPRSYFIAPNPLLCIWIAGTRDIPRLLSTVSDVY